MKLFLICLSVFVSLNSLAQDNNCKPSKIEITANNFHLEYNDNGQLIKATDKNSYVYTLLYNENGELAKTECFDSSGDLYESYVYYEDKVEQYDEDGLYVTYIYVMEDGFPVKIIEDNEGDQEVVSELVWKDGNVIEESVFKKGAKSTYHLQYDDNTNILSTLRFYVDFTNLLSYAEIFSKNNIIKVTTDSKVLDLPIEINENGCVSKIPRNQFGVGKDITY